MGFFFCSVWFINVLVNYWVISRAGPKTESLTILRAASHETELGDHDLCLSRSHYTDTEGFMVHAIVEVSITVSLAVEIRLLC